MALQFGVSRDTMDRQRAARSGARPALRPTTDQGGNIGTGYLRSPTRAGQTTPQVPGDTVGRRQGYSMATNRGPRPGSPTLGNRGREGGGDVGGRIAALGNGREGGGSRFEEGFAGLGTMLAGRDGAATGVGERVRPGRPGPAVHPGAGPGIQTLPGGPGAGMGDPGHMLPGGIPGPTDGPGSGQVPDLGGLLGGAQTAGAPGVPQDVGPLGTEAIGLGNLGAILERRLANPGAYGLNEVQQTRDWLASERAAERASGMSGINADMARRGVYHSTTGAPAISGLEEKLARAAEMGDVALLEKVAMSQQSGLDSAIGDTFRFLENAGQNQNTFGNLGSLAAQLGMQGAPDINQAATNFVGLPGGTPPGLDPSVLAMLGTLLPGSGGGQPQAQASPGPQIPSFVLDLLGGGKNMPQIPQPGQAVIDSMQPKPARPNLDPADMLPPELLSILG